MILEFTPPSMPRFLPKKWQALLRDYEVCHDVVFFPMDFGDLAEFPELY